MDGWDCSGEEKGWSWSLRFDEEGGSGSSESRIMRAALPSRSWERRIFEEVRFRRPGVGTGGPRLVRVGRAARMGAVVWGVGS